MPYNLHDLRSLYNIYMGNAFAEDDVDEWSDDYEHVIFPSQHRGPYLFPDAHILSRPRDFRPSAGPSDIVKQELLRQQLIQEAREREAEEARRRIEEEENESGVISVESEGPRRRSKYTTQATRPLKGLFGSLDVLNDPREMQQIISDTLARKYTPFAPDYHKLAVSTLTPGYIQNLNKYRYNTYSKRRAWPSIPPPIRGTKRPDYSKVSRRFLSPEMYEILDVPIESDMPSSSMIVQPGPLSGSQRPGYSSMSHIRGGPGQIPLTPSDADRLGPISGSRRPGYSGTSRQLPSNDPGQFSEIRYILNGYRW